MKAKMERASHVIPREVRFWERLGGDTSKTMIAVYAVRSDQLVVTSESLLSVL